MQFYPGAQSRRRTCDNPKPINSEEGCNGISLDFLLCKDDKVIHLFIIMYYNLYLYLSSVPKLGSLIMNLPCLLLVSLRPVAFKLLKLET